MKLADFFHWYLHGHSEAYITVRKSTIDHNFIIELIQDYSDAKNIIVYNIYCRYNNEQSYLLKKNLENYLYKLTLFDLDQVKELIDQYLIKYFNQPAFI